MADRAVSLGQHIFGIYGSTDYTHKKPEVNPAILSHCWTQTKRYDKEHNMARAARTIATLIFQTRCADHARSSGLHRDMREMIRWAEGKFSDMTAAEHHITGDGFLSTPLDYAAMIFGATETMKVSGCAVLAPLYNPLTWLNVSPFWIW